jgi:hypothetical protein
MEKQQDNGADSKYVWPEGMNLMDWMKSTPLYGTDFEFDFRGPLLDDWGPVARVKSDSEIAAAEKALKEARTREQASES